jgi:hypothetical protein
MLEAVQGILVAEFLFVHPERLQTHWPVFRCFYDGMNVKPGDISSASIP